MNPLWEECCDAAEGGPVRFVCSYAVWPPPAKPDRCKVEETGNLSYQNKINGHEET